MSPCQALPLFGVLNRRSPRVFLPLPHVRRTHGSQWGKSRSSTCNASASPLLKPEHARVNTSAYTWGLGAHTLRLAPPLVVDKDPPCPFPFFNLHSHGC